MSLPNRSTWNDITGRNRASQPSGGGSSFRFSSGAFGLGGDGSGGQQQPSGGSGGSGGGGGGGTVSQKEDPQIKQIIDQFINIMTNDTTNLRAERQSLEARLAHHRNQLISASFLNYGGSSEVAQAIAQTSAQEVATLEYLLSQLDTNPELYVQAKKMGIISELGQFLQGMAGMGTAKYTPEAYSVQRYQAGAAYQQARGGGGGYYVPQQDNSQEMKYYMDMMQSLLQNTQGKERQGVINAFKKILGGIGMGF